MGLENRSSMPRKKIAITVGCFDLFHYGHNNIFEKMKNLADEIHVGIHDDESIFENKKFYTEENLKTRWSKIDPMVDKLFLVDEADPSSTLEKIIIQNQKKGYEMCYVRGDDWSDFPGRKLVESYGIPIILIPYTKGISSTMLRAKLNDER